MGGALRCPSGLSLGAHGSICILLPLLEPPMNASHSRGLWMVKQVGGADNVLTPLKDPDHSPSSLPERGATTSHHPREGARETRLGLSGRKGRS